MCAATAPVTVKQERHDEAEIKEMAEKIMEVHKQQIAKAAATATLQQQQQILPGAAAGTAGVRTGAGMLAAGAAGGTQAGATANGVVAAATAAAAAAAAAAAGGQANILNYLTRKPSANTTAAANNNGAATVGMHLGTGAGAVSQNGTAKGAGGVGGGTLDGGSPEVCDEESQKGHFGWETFPNKTYIPYILREQERYCSVRMLETRLLGKYLNYLHQDIYTCTCVKSYYITETESKLLNEINAKHSDMYFGREMFTVNDGVVRLTDAHKFYRFLDVCYHKLMMGCSTPNDKCGFIRINKESVVPYTVRDGQKMVPLFYFEGETDNLRLKADNLSGWDLSYLKFCCKVQGIRNELFASDSVAVISLTDIKGYFPPGTEFEDYWPSKVVDSQLLSGSKSNNTVHWTRQPAHAPQKTSGAMHGGGGGGGGSQGRKAANNSNSSSNNNNSNSNAYQALPTQANLAKSNLQMNSITAAAVQALSNNWNLVNGNHGNILSQQEQLLRISQAQQTAQAQAQIRSMQFQQYSSYLNSALSMAPRGSQNQAVPPPLVRSQAAHLSNMAGATLSQQHQQQLQQAAAAQQQAVQQQQQQQQQQSQSSGGSGSKRSASGSSGHSGGSSRSSTIISSSSGGGGGSSGGSITSNNSYRNAASVSVLQQLQQQQQAAAAAAAVAAAAAAVVGSVGDTPRNLTIIPELNIGVTPYKPYEVVKKPVENKVIYCVNKTPYRHNEYLMTIFDLKDVFFPYVSVEMCRRVLTALEINLFIGNSLQYQALLEAGRTNVDKMPMVQVTDVMTYMPQLQYMVRSQIQDTPASKRARIS